MKIDTLCVQAGYEPKNGEPRVVPIAQSTTFVYDTAETMGKLFDLEESGFFYTRLGNPTLDAVEKKIAALEGGVGAMLTSSGQSAVLALTMNLCQAGENFLCSSEIYGGTINLMSAEFSRMGIEV
ncbi:MAG: O-acetylhomoserine aminocarboxypropyltransferase/cysteine synthase, partial [Ruminococcus sp.]|nr:O-acetylhomoserine aminocarboxypropyltransferase/cysteine synthase [Ruminococcus sp.]